MYLFMAGETTDTSVPEETVEETVSIGEKIFNSVVSFMKAYQIPRLIFSIFLALVVLIVGCIIVKRIVKNIYI